MIGARHDTATCQFSAQRPEDLSHSSAVANIAVHIAAVMGFSKRVLARLRLAGNLHDIGKVGLPGAILNKPGPLDPDEWALVRRHPEMGEEILLRAGVPDISPWVRCHHERFDGRGYPDRLEGSEIPIEARILAVADAYHAMVSERPYSASKSEADARQELRACAGGQFDPEVVAAFLSDGRPAAAEHLSVGSPAIHLAVISR